MLHTEKPVRLPFFALCSTFALGAALSLSALGCPDAAPEETAETKADAGADAAEQEEDAGDPCPASGIGKGPWSLRVDETSAEIRWEACRAGTVPKLVFRPEAGGDEQEVASTEEAFEVTLAATAPLAQSEPADVAGTFYMHAAKLGGLSPSTCYTYRLAGDADRKGRFCTARASGEPFTFMAIGDTNPGLGDNAEKVLSQALSRGPDFALHAGDVQYYDSGLETWASWFPAMQPLLSHGAFYPTIGNHELEKPGELEQYYARFFGGAGWDGTLERYRFHSGGVWFFALNTEQPIAEGAPQVEWLAEELADAAAQPGYRFSVVWLHRPLATCGDTSSDTSGRELLEPLFQKHGVELVVQGHMHGYERFEINGVTYVTAAGGGGALGNVDENIDRPECAMREASGAFYHAVLFGVGNGVLEGVAVDESGKERDSFSKEVP